MQVNLAEAKRNLSKLIKAVERGEAVTICREGVPVVDMVPARRHPPSKKRKLGTLKGQIQVIDPDWWKSTREEKLNTIW